MTVYSFPMSIHYYSFLYPSLWHCILFRFIFSSCKIIFHNFSFFLHYPNIISNLLHSHRFDFTFLSYFQIIFFFEIGSEEDGMIQKKGWNGNKNCKEKEEGKLMSWKNEGINKLSSFFFFCQNKFCCHQWQHFIVNSKTDAMRGWISRQANFIQWKPNEWQQ